LRRSLPLPYTHQLLHIFFHHINLSISW
jgi:hypothetical protein